MARRVIVVDANIMIRATLGTRARAIIKASASTAQLCAPSSVWVEAEINLLRLASRRQCGADALLTLLRKLGRYVEVVDERTYGAYEAQARGRLDRRDPDDWPVLACALALDCPIWTEDKDFFGCGVPTWTSDRVELYFKEN